jgi:hypothetical protein
MAGSHVAVLSPTPAVPVTTGCDASDSVMADPVAVMVPVVVMEPGSYATSAAGTVSAAVAPPVVQAVDEATAVQAAVSEARSSVTTTAPRAPVMVVPGALVPRSTLTGAVIESEPELTAKVTVVSGSPAFGLDEYASTAGLAVAADAATGVSAMPPMAATARIENAALTILLPL